ncbi:MAG TPA: bifunctional nuclease domain-containing protein [Bacteroidota bacterium]
MERVPVDILGLSTSPASGGAFALILREMNGNRRLPIIIGAAEAQSIALEMEGIKPPRPLTHDLMKNIITAFGAELSDIIIDELRDGTFYAKLNIDNQLIDSRPSDAIALAVRYGAQIYVAASVMDEAAFVPEEEEEEQQQAQGGQQEPQPPQQNRPAKPKQPSASQSKSQKLEQLRQQLQDALEHENYEKAAQLRDEIRKLELRD